jgi:hypothetical protein
MVDDDDPRADTLTNADGGYSPCSVGNPEIVGEVRVRKPGYRNAFQVVDATWTADFELVRD